MSGLITAREGKSHDFMHARLQKNNEKQQKTAGVSLFF